MDYEPVDGRIRSSLLPILLISGVAFIAGLALMAWVISSWSGAGRALGITPVAASAPQAVRPTVVAPPPAVVATAPGEEPQRFVIDPETTRRVSQLERRVAQVDEQSRSAVGNADRAEGLLVAFAARRALDRGVPARLYRGAAAAAVRRQPAGRGGDHHHQCRQPVTLEELQEGLQEVGPGLTGTGPDRTWWTAFKHELAGLVTVRKSGSPSTLPAERLERAQRRLDAGQVDVALAEVLRMPGRENASEWIADAQRYVASRRALDAIETAALLEPRNPALLSQQAGLHPQDPS